MRSALRSTASLLLPFAALAVLPACAKSPPARSPLREQLAAADTSSVEEAARKCLADGGWKVDEVGSVSAGANVVTAYKAKDQTDVYVYPRDQVPRVTGGPADDDTFWPCLEHALGPVAGGSDKADGADKADEAGKDKDGDKTPAPPASP
jgi:hypothetical protein